MASMLPLHLATLVAFFSAVIAPGVLAQKKASLGGVADSGGVRRSAFALVPRPVQVACAATAVYAVLNFVLFLQGTGGGNAVEQHGKYFLKNHGKVIRELDRQEYD